MQQLRILVGPIAALLTVVAPSARAVAPDGSPFLKLAGRWTGAGSAQFEGHRSERLTCRGYYTNKSSGAELGIALRCASAAAKIELRSQLNLQNGRISGSWEERSFNAAGSVSGRISGSSMHLNIGGGLSGSISVNFGDSSQAIVMTITGTELKGISINLIRRYSD